MINFDKKFAALFSGKPRSEDNEDGVSHEEFIQYDALFTPFISQLMSFTSTSVGCRAFQAFGLFTSGIGVHYLPSAIVNPQHQSLASNLPIGQRMPPHIFIRAADSRPVELQDLLPSDTRFKVLVFTGDTTDMMQLKRIRTLAEELDKPEGFLKRFGKGDSSAVFNVLSISSAKKEKSNYTDVPPVFRTHWSKYVAVR